MSVQIDLKNNELIIKFDYSFERISKIKSIKGYRWDANKKVWVLPYSNENVSSLKRLFNTERCTISFEDNTQSNQLYKAMSDEIKLKGYSHKTLKAYLNHIKIFSSFINKEMITVQSEDIRKYILHLLNEQQCSHSYASQAISAIKFLFCEVLKTNINVYDLPRPKKEKKLPDILSQEEVFKILKALDNQKHRAILFLVYSAGLRVGEVVRLKVGDIDSKRMLIHIRQSKGAKDRYTVLSQVCLEQLRAYAKIYRPEMWLFPGPNKARI